MQVAFGEWLPDQASHLNPGANVANNVYYAATSYKPFPDRFFSHRRNGL